MSQANLDLGVLQDTKITDGVYTRGSDGYIFISMDMPIKHCSLVVVFYRASPQFAIEAIQQFGLNVASFQLATGVWRW